MLRALGLLYDVGLGTPFFGEKDMKLCLPGNVWDIENMLIFTQIYVVVNK